MAGNGSRGHGGAPALCEGFGLDAPRRVRDAVRELDYTINDLARSLQTRKTRTAGMLIPDIASPFYAKVVRGAEDVLRASGYSLILGNTYNSPEEQSRYLTVFEPYKDQTWIRSVAAARLEPDDGEAAAALVELSDGSRHYCFHSLHPGRKYVIDGRVTVDGQRASKPGTRVKDGAAVAFSVRALDLTVDSSLLLVGAALAIVAHQRVGAVEQHTDLLRALLRQHRRDRSHPCAKSIHSHRFFLGCRNLQWTRCLRRLLANPRKTSQWRRLMPCR